MHRRLVGGGIISSAFDLQSLEQLLDSLPLGVALNGSGPDFRFAYANTMIQSLNPGMTMAGMPFRDCWPGQGEDVEALLARVWESGVPVSDVASIVNVQLDGGQLAQRELESSITLVEVNGERYLLTTCSDVTERAQAQRASERAFRRELEANVVLQETSRLALSSLKPDVLAQRVVADMQRRFGLLSCNVWTIDRETGLLVQIAQVGFGEHPPPLKLTDESDGVRSVVTGKTVLRPDTSSPETPKTSRRVLAMLSPDPMALLSVPLQTDDGTFGCLVMIWPEPRVFAEAEVAMFEAMAAGVALGLRNARLDEAAAAESALKAGANRILEAALFAGSAEELASVCLEVACELTDADLGLIGEVHDEGDERPNLKVTTIYAGQKLLEDEQIAQGMQRMNAAEMPRDGLSIGFGGLPGLVVESGETLLANDAAERSEAGPFPSGHPTIRSFLGVPIKRAGDVVGVVAVSNRVGGFREQDRRALESLTPAIAAALDGVRARSELAQSNRLLSAHMENSPIAVVEFDSDFRVIRWSQEAERTFGYAQDEIMGRSITEMRWVYEDDRAIVAAESHALLVGERPRSKNVNRNYRKDGSVIWCEWYSSGTYDEDGNLLSVLSLALDITERMSLMDALVESERRANELIRHAPTGIFEVHLAKPEFVFVNDAMLEMTGFTRDELLVMSPIDLLVGDSRERFVERLARAAESGLEDEEIEYTLGRKDGEEACMLMNVRYAHDSAGRTLSAFVIAHDITERKRIETERARLLAEERESARLNEALTRIDRHIHGTFDRDLVYERVVNEAGEAMGADGAAVLIYEDGVMRLRYLYGIPQGIAEREISTAHAPATLRARETGKPVFIEDTMTDPRTRGVAAESLSTGALVMTPVTMRGEVVSVVLLAFVKPREFSEAERTFARRLAASVGLALANIELFESEREVAETLQETLVVMPDHVRGVSYSHAYRSATAERGRVGGDFIDIFEVSDSLVGISLGDVSGKGIEAAVLTSLVRTTLRVHALDGKAPHEIADKTNRVMRRSTSIESYVTLWFGLLDTKSGLLRYVSAGHPPALIVDASGEIRPLACLDPILGAFEDVAFVETQFLLAEGDRIILYTDGVTEARSPDGAFLDSTGLHEIVETRAKTPTDDLAHAILAAVVDFSAGVLRDDVAVLVVEADQLDASPIG